MAIIDVFLDETVDAPHLNIDASVYETVNNQGLATGRATGTGIASSFSIATGGKDRKIKGRAADGVGAAHATGLRGHAGFASAGGLGGADGAAAPIVSLYAVGFAPGVGHAAAPSVAGVAGFAPAFGDAAAEYNFESEFYGIAIGGGDGVARGPEQAAGLSAGSGDAFALASGAALAIGAADATGAAAGYIKGDTASVASAPSTGDAVAIASTAGSSFSFGQADGTGQAAASAATVDARIYEAAGALDLGDATVEAATVPIDGGGAYYPPLQRPFPVVGRGYGVLPQLEGEAHGVVGVAGKSAAQLLVRAAAIGACGQAGDAAAVLKALAAGHGVVGTRGTGEGMIMKFSGSATGRHDDDEAAVIAFLLAA